MLLRRMIEHVKAQNWTAVALDFVIVVVGVFIGIQVANWNEAQADQRLGRDYQQRIIADLRQDYASVEILYTYYGGVLASVEEADRLLSAPDPDPAALITAAYRSSEFAGATLQRSTWDEVVSAGHIGLLPAPSREAGLFDYYSALATLKAFLFDLINSPYRQAVRSVIPIAVQAEIRAHCGDVMDERGIPTGFATDCTLDIDPDVLRQTRDALIASQAVRETLHYQYSMVRTVQSNNVGARLMLTKLINNLDGTVITEGRGDE